LFGGYGRPPSQRTGSDRRRIPFPAPLLPFLAPFAITSAVLDQRESFFAVWIVLSAPVERIKAQTTPLLTGYHIDSDMWAVV
jgi:hypothetical protein